MNIIYKIISNFINNKSLYIGEKITMSEHMIQSAMIAEKAKLPNSKVWIELPMNTNEFYEFSNIPPQLSFTSSEHNIGKSILKSMNIKENDKFICFYGWIEYYINGLFNYEL